MLKVSHPLSNEIIDQNPLAEEDILHSDSAPLHSNHLDDWAGHGYFSLLQAAAEANTVLKQLPNGQESHTNIGPIQV